jgi:site-specific DNA recombinase
VTATVQTKAALYLRVSLDATGEMLAIERQRDACMAIAKSRGWEVVAEYVDNSRSASYASKSRPGYDALVAAYTAGDYGALICWDLDRLTRQPRQLEDWADRAESRGLLLVTANGEADLATDAGRLFARIKIAVARSEVDRKSARQTAAARQRAAKGKPPLGVRLTGYTAAGEVVEHEARIVRRIFESFAAGDSLRSLAAQLDAAGVPTRHGRPWHPSSVRTMLTNPRYPGRAVYQGEETGEAGEWKPLIDVDLFALVQARLHDPRRVTNRLGTDRKYLGSGLYLCDECSEPVRSFSGGRYRCRHGHVNRSRRHIDALVLAVVRERLSRPDVRKLVKPSKDAAAPLLADARRLRDRLGAIAADYDAGRIDGARYAVATEKVSAELIGVENRLSRMTFGDSAAAAIAAPDPVAYFDALALMPRRAVVDALLTVRLKRAARGRTAFDPDSVTIGWKGKS